MTAQKPKLFLIFALLMCLIASTRCSFGSGSRANSGDDTTSNGGTGGDAGSDNGNDDSDNGDNGDDEESYSLSLRDALGNSANEVDTTLTLNAGTSVTYYVAKYYGGGLFVENVTGTWTAGGVLNGHITEIADDGVMISPTTTGSGTVTFTPDAGTTGSVVIDVTVQLGSLATLTIRTAANGGGSALNNPTLTSGSPVTYYAAGYDSANNLIGNITGVTWDDGGVLNGRAVDNGDGSVTITPTTAGNNGTLTVTKNSISDGIGTATVNPGALASLTIRTATSGGGAIVNNPTLTTITDTTYYAAGYDANNNYIQDYDGTWSGGGILSTAITDNGDGSATINANTAGSGTLTITSNALSDGIGTATVNLNTPSFTALSTTLDALVISEVTDMDTTYDLDEHVLNGGDSGDWDIPTLPQLTLMYECIEKLRRYVHDSEAIVDEADLISKLESLNYEVFNMTDTSTGMTYFVVKEEENDQPERHGWGTIVINKAPSLDLVIAAPHPIHDLYTERAAARLMSQTEALVLVMAGSHRRASEFVTPEFFLNNKFSTADYRYSDPSHNTASVFHYACLSFMTDFTTMIQVHGYSMVDNGVAGDIVVSSGSRNTTDPTTGNVVLTDSDNLYTDVVTALEGTTSAWDALIFDGINLSSATNVTGRTTILGNTVRTLGTGKFIQLETDTALRNNVSNRNEYIDALAGVNGL